MVLRVTRAVVIVSRNISQEFVCSFFCHFVSYFRVNFNQEFQGKSEHVGINLFQLEMVDCIKCIFLHFLYVYFMTVSSSFTVCYWI